MRAPLLLLVLGLAGCSVLTPSRRAGPDASLTGTWAGEAQQFDDGVPDGTPDSKWTVEVTLGPASRVSYPSLGCSGDLTYTGDVPGGAAFTETIRVGADRCIPTGTVVLTRRGAGLAYRASHESAPSVSTGRLSRR